MILFFKHQLFIYHHFQERDKPVFVQIWKLLQNTFKVTMIPAKQVNLSGHAFKAMS